MLARRVIALSPDKAFAKQLGTALRAAGGAVEVHTGLDGLGRGEIQAALIAVHADGELADVIPTLAPRLAGDGKIIAILPKCDLDRTIKLMNTADRVSGVLIAEHLKSGDLAAMATRILAGDIFGLEKTVPWGTKIYSQLVGDYQEKSVCIAQISEFAETMGVRRKYREAIEQVVDEMLMNALYDAPVDDHGKQLFAEIPTKTRISLRMEQKVVVQYACDDRTFAISVRDSYGTLDRGTVVKYIDKCLHSPEQIDRKTGGAGLGLYLMANSSTRMFFNVLPGVATEAVCSFDLDSPKVQLQKFGFFHERIDAAGRLAAGPSRLLPQGMSHPVERRQRDGGPPPPAKAPAAVIAALSMAIVLLLVLIALVAYPRLRNSPKGSIRVATAPGATVEVGGKVRGVAGSDGMLVVDGLELGRGYRVSVRLAGHKAVETLAEPDADRATEVDLALVPEQASVTIETDPRGATVVLADGRELGKTPLTWTQFTPGTEVSVKLVRQGYGDELVAIRVPDGGGASTVSRQLQVSADVATIRITSDPPGAVIFLDGQRQAGVATPSDEILVEADKKHVVRLELPGYMPASVSVTPAHGARAVPVEAKLERALSLTVSSNLDARLIVVGAPLCEKQPMPFTCQLRRGKHQLRVETTKLQGRIVRDVVIADRDVTLDLAWGVVTAPKGHKLIVSGKAVDRAAFEAGKRVLVTIRDAEGVTGQVEVKPVVGKTVEAQ